MSTRNPIVSNNSPEIISRRAMLKNGSLIIAAAGVNRWCDLSAFATDAKKPEKLNVEKPTARIGLFTDVHYADRKPRGTRHYRESIPKMQEAIAKLNDQQAEMAICLGDYIDAAKQLKTELGYLKTIEAEYQKFKGERYYVYGNHCLDTLTKKEFKDNTAMKADHSSFDSGGFHFILLDACFTKAGKAYGRKNFVWTDTNIPQTQIDWLAADLKKTDKPTIVCVHQRLDVKGAHGIKNAPQVRKVLEASKKVQLVLMGHSHKNSYQNINEIHYCVIRAVVEGSGKENSSYALMQLFNDKSIRINGFRKQKNRLWKS